MISLENLNDRELEQVLADAWLGIYVNEHTLFNPLDRIPEEFLDKPHVYIMWLMSQPEYFSFLCKEILNVQIYPLQAVILQELWNRKFPMLIGSRGLGKSFILALYALLRMLLLPGRKIVAVGAGFRQSRLIWEYMGNIWKNAPVLKDLMGGDVKKFGPKREIDMCRFEFNNGSIMTALPIGDGQKIRGLRANDIIADEFASMVLEVFETVIAGFGVVTATPIDNIRRRARQDLARRLGKIIHIEKNLFQDNQIVLSGTAYYEFNHFADYWKKWKAIIHSKGDVEKLEKIFKGDIPTNFDWRDYSVIRVPFELVPKGFMDEAMVARSKATVHAGIYEMEYGAVFSKDSTGFFKRSLIESCVPSITNPITIDEVDIKPSPLLSGNRKKEYIMAIDPASEQDNFAVTILELNERYRSIAYVWTINNKEHKELLKDGIVNENDFYSFCCMKIRELCRKFNIIRIMVDSGGGGYAIREGLHDKNRIPEGEEPFWEVIDYEDPKDSDSQKGRHIIEIVEFSDNKWVRDANHGLRKDFEDKVLLFPYFDTLSIGLAEIKDDHQLRTYDTLQDCYLEIEELKNELCTIIMTQTPTGKDKWDTPELKLPGGKKGRLRKDRYSALLMANMGARMIPQRTVNMIDTEVGGFAAGIKNSQGDEYSGPDWFIKAMKGLYD